jgi:Predicted xylanase/chitin deacetylase
MVMRGHGIANHSDTHPAAFFWCLLPAALRREIDGCSEAIAAVTGQLPRWFRAPVGMKNPAVHPLLQKRQMRLIGWSIRGFDSIASEPQSVIRRIVPRVQPGSIIVMHQGRAISIPCIIGVVEALPAGGYSFVIPPDDRLKTSR